MTVLSPLHSTAQEHGAVFGLSMGWSLPRRFTSLTREYDALRHNVALVDRSHVGCLRLRGKDAQDLLHRLSTNRLDNLEIGQCRDTVLTTAKGRILDIITVARFHDNLLLLTSPGQNTKVTKWLDTYTFLEECFVNNNNQSEVTLSLLGPLAGEALSQVMDLRATLPQKGRTSIVKIEGIETVILARDPLGLPGYDLVVSWNQAHVLWRRLVKNKGIKVQPVGFEALDITRIENGIGNLGSEYGEAVNPLEAGLGALIDFGKGCFIGQEVIARLNTYDKVRRRLVGMLLDGSSLPKSRSEQPRIIVDGVDIGWLTSWRRRPRSQRWLALGYVRRPFWKPGTTVYIQTSLNLCPAKVTKLPFPGSSRRHRVSLMSGS